jgi:NTE family protein
MSETKKIDLALQGGGAHGAFTWGVIDRILDDTRIEIDGICGTSAGAMNGVCTSYGLLKGGRSMAKHLLVKFWHKISEAGKKSSLQPTWLDKFMSPGNMDFSPTYRFFSLTADHLTPSQFNPLKINPLEKILNELIDFDELHKMNPPKLFVCATNVKTCTQKTFGPQEITSKAVMASACIPYLYEAVEIDGEHYWDGGFMGNPPLEPLTNFTEGTDDILLIQINPVIIKEVPKTIEDIKDRVNEISFNSSLSADVKHLLFVNKLVADGFHYNGALKNINLHNICTDNILGDLNFSSKLNTSWEFLMYLKDLGYKAGSDWLERHYDSIGVRTTFNT